jgi:hypothetical protein
MAGPVQNNVEHEVRVAALISSQHALALEALAALARAATLSRRDRGAFALVENAVEPIGIHLRH